MKVLIVVFLMLFLFSHEGGAQNVSLITYGVEDGDVFVKWKSAEKGINFSVYRSAVMISNVASFSNNLSSVYKLGTFSQAELRREKEYFYLIDPKPNVGTNYYFIFGNKNGEDIIEFIPEQNYSSGFIVYIPLPKVSVELVRGVNNAIIRWEKVEGAEGYLVYKLRDSFSGNLSKVQPLVQLTSNETIFFDVIPSDTNFFYVVVPFTKHYTNYYFSRKYNGIFMEMSKRDFLEGQTYGQKFVEVKSHLQNLREIALTNHVTNYVTNFATNYVTVYTTNEVVLFQTNTVTLTNLVFYTNMESRVVDNIGNQKTVQEIKPLYTAPLSQEYVQPYDLELQQLQVKLKYIVLKFFNKKDYSTARSMLRELLSEVREDSELKGRIMIYLARAEYILGNREEAIATLFRAVKILPEEAGFWLDRFLVNR
ncbi:MAG: tetratricopeptide repeat protein [Brevinematia bacterium]